MMTAGGGIEHMKDLVSVFGAVLAEYDGILVSGDEQEGAFLSDAGRADISNPSQKNWIRANALSHNVKILHADPVISGGYGVLIDAMLQGCVAGAAGRRWKVGLFGAFLDENASLSDVVHAFVCVSAHLEPIMADRDAIFEIHGFGHVMENGIGVLNLDLFARFLAWRFDVVEDYERIIEQSMSIMGRAAQPTGASR